MADKNLSSNYDIKQYISDTVAPKYFNMDQVNDLNIGLLGMVSELMSGLTEDTLNTATTYLNEMHPNLAIMPESIYSQAALFHDSNLFAKPAEMVAWLIVSEEYVLANKESNGRDMYKFFIDSDMPINVENIQFMLDYDIAINIYERPNGFVYSANYNMHRYGSDSDVSNNKSYINSISGISFGTDPYIKINRIYYNNEHFLAMMVTLHQVTQHKENETVINNTILDATTFNVHVDGQLAGFNIFCKLSGETSYTQLELKLLGSPAVKDVPFCYYRMTDDDELEISFTLKDGYYKPTFGSEVIIEYYTTLAEDGNFDLYTGSDIISTGSSNNYLYNNGMIVFCVPHSDSKYGASRISVDELKNKNIENFSTIKSYTTENDLQLYFERFDDYNNIATYVVKKRDDIEERVFTTYTRYTDDDGDIVRANTCTLDIPASVRNEINTGSYTTVVIPNEGFPAEDGSSTDIVYWFTADDGFDYAFSFPQDVSTLDTLEIRQLVNEYPRVTLTHNDTSTNLTITRVTSPGGTEISLSGTGNVTEFEYTAINKIENSLSKFKTFTNGVKYIKPGQTFVYKGTSKHEVIMIEDAVSDIKYISIPSDGLAVGVYYITLDTTSYEFTLTRPVTINDTLMINTFSALNPTLTLVSRKTDADNLSELVDKDIVLREVESGDTPAGTQLTSMYNPDFMYASPFLITLTTNPTIIGYYLNYINDKYTIDYKSVNTDSIVQFVCNSITINRNPINSKFKYVTIPFAGLSADNGGTPITYWIKFNDTDYSFTLPKDVTYTDTLKIVKINDNDSVVMLGTNVGSYEITLTPITGTPTGTELTVTDSTNVYIVKATLLPTTETGEISSGTIGTRSIVSTPIGTFDNETGRVVQAVYEISGSYSAGDYYTVIDGITYEFSIIGEGSTSFIRINVAKKQVVYEANGYVHIGTVDEVTTSDNIELDATTGEGSNVVLQFIMNNSVFIFMNVTEYDRTSNIYTVTGYISTNDMINADMMWINDTYTYISPSRTLTAQNETHSIPMSNCPVRINVLYTPRTVTVTNGMNVYDNTEIQTNEYEVRENISFIKPLNMVRSNIKFERAEITKNVLMCHNITIPSAGITAGQYYITAGDTSYGFTTEHDISSTDTLKVTPSTLAVAYTSSGVSYLSTAQVITTLTGTELDHTSTFTGDINYNDFTSMVDTSIDSFPLVSKEVLINEEKISKLIENYDNQYEYINGISDKLTGNHAIDLKFYNTYGRSKNFVLENGQYINTVNIGIIFRVKVEYGTDEDIFIRNVKMLIKDYVEKINEGGGNFVYVSNIIQLVENEYPAVRYIKFGGIKGNGNIYALDNQTIENVTSDITSLSVSERRNYVPEYLTISVDDIDIIII